MGNGDEFFGDLEREFLMDSLFIWEAEIETEEDYKAWLKQKSNKNATIREGKSRKSRKFESYGTIRYRIPRKLKKALQHKHR
jgi:uncharacterized protein involved in tolerance to divalent cations